MSYWKVYLNKTFVFDDGSEYTEPSEIYLNTFPFEDNIEDVIATAYEFVAEESLGAFDYLSFCDVVNVLKWQPINDFLADFQEVDLGEWAA